MTKLTKEQLRNIIEHDYHQVAFTKEKFLDEILESLEKAKKWDKINQEPFHENTALALEQEIEKRKQKELELEVVKADCRSALKLRKLLIGKLNESTLFEQAVKKRFEDTSYVPLEEINKAIKQLIEESKLD